MLLIFLKLTIKRETRTIIKNDVAKLLIRIRSNHIETHNAKRFLVKSVLKKIRDVVQIFHFL
jgi:hypothetical protein